MSHFVHVIFSRFYLFAYLFSPTVHWTYDDQFFCQAVCTSPFWGVFHRDLFCFFSGILFPWFFMCLEVLALRSLHLKKSPSSCGNQLALGDKEVRHQSAQLEFRASLRPFLWVCWLHSSHSLTVGKIRLVCFLSILQSQYECGKPPIYFPQRSALKCSKLRTFAGWGGSSQLLTSCAPSCRGLTCAVCWRVWVLAVDGVRVSDEASCWQEPVSQLLGCWLSGSTHLLWAPIPFP